MVTPLPSRLRRLVALLLICAASAVGAVSAAPAATATPVATTGHHHHQDWQVLVGNQSRNQAIQGMRFLPGQIWINEGDTVTWQANAAEIHTVTFFKGGDRQQTIAPFDPADPAQTMRTDGQVYDPSRYFNSGLLSTSSSFSAFPTIPVYQQYTLKFAHDGNFTYYCLVHGRMMVGTIHVREENTPYPFSQAQYDHQAAVRSHMLLADGRHLLASTRARSTRHHVFAGAQDDKVMIMRFLRGTVRIRVGTQVTFDNINVIVPHTVTFGPEQSGTSLLAPYGDPTSFSSGQLSSGILQPGQKFTVTFTKAGTFPYICILHDDMGMVGKVIVR